MCNVLQEFTNWNPLTLVICTCNVGKYVDAVQYIVLAVAAPEFSVTMILTQRK